MRQRRQHGGACIVTAIDISPDLLEMARQRVTNANVSFVEADAETYAFEPNAFDALYSRFGSMFFDDPLTAFRNIHGALKPGGRAIFLAWRAPGRNQWASVPMTFVAEGATSGGPSP